MCLLCMLEAIIKIRFVIRVLRLFRINSPSKMCFILWIGFGFGHRRLRVRQFW